MSLRRFLVDQPPVGDVVIDGDLFHHVRDVCRFDVGRRFELLPGDGTAHLVEITHVGKRELTVRALGTRRLPPPPKPGVVLCLSIPKLPKVDWIVEKAVELGVAEIKPFVSEFSFLRKVAEVSDNRLERWRKLVRAATQQTGRGDLLRIARPVTLRALLDEFAGARDVAGVFPYEGDAAEPLPEAITRVRAAKPERVWAFVGSEGGFSPAEVDLFAARGLPATSMGEQILRVETACLALVSVLKYELGALG